MWKLIAVLIIFSGVMLSFFSAPLAKAIQSLQKGKLITSTLTWSYQLPILLTALLVLSIGISFLFWE